MGMLPFFKKQNQKQNKTKQKQQITSLHYVLLWFSGTRTGAKFGKKLLVPHCSVSRSPSGSYSYHFLRYCSLLESGNTRFSVRFNGENIVTVSLMCHLEERWKIQNYSINITFSIKKEEYRACSPKMSSLISAYSVVFYLKALMVFLSISSFFIRAILYYLGHCIEQRTMKAKRQRTGGTEAAAGGDSFGISFWSDYYI